jgi:hypothetical protein
MRTSKQQQHIEEQIAVSTSLGLGFALSLIPTAGLGSLAALIIGLRARKKILAAPHVLAGLGMALWCIVAGSVGLVASVCILGALVLSTS